jgi:glucosyl-3-phosphoglycerate synthase
MIKRILQALGLVKTEKVSVVIPVLNEEKTIAGVIQLARKSSSVNEVIVVDDNSADRTAEIAEQNHAIVIKSVLLGKGHSMKEGFQQAKNRIVVYLDGDIGNYEGDMIQKLAEPLINNRCDFVKSTFSRDAGRVTELVAKPLLSILYPELTAFSQPLSGMIAATKEFLEKVNFENDYGVDIGILIDMHNLGARIMEVNIGKIDNKSKPWQELGKMSREVSKAILKRAEIKKLLSLDELQSLHIIQDEMENSIVESISKLEKMLILDMDNTILMDRFIYRMADKYGFRNKINDIVSKNNEPFLITKLIARLLKGMYIQSVFEVLDEIKIVPDLTEVIKTLKSRGYIIVIISDSYDLVTNYIKNKIGADIALSNELEVKNRIITGEVRIPSYFIRNEDSLCNHNICKSNAVSYISRRCNVKLSNTIVVGDSENDICMIRMAGVGVSFCSESKLLDSVADKVIKERRFRELLSFAN